MIRYLVPAVAAIAVLSIAAVLIFVVTLRPWSGADRGFDTHLNFRGEPPESYTRTNVTEVETEPRAPEGWKMSAFGLANIDRGNSLYIGLGCASCHGLNGEGTASGPAVRGASLRRTTNLIRDGSGGMPVYHEADLRQSDIEAISSYILSFGPPPTETPVTTKPTATPWPTPTLSPTPTTPPSPTPTITPTPVPGSELTPTAPTPTPEPTHTPEPTSTPQPELSPAEFEAAQQLFLDVACDTCHGLQAEGSDDGPELKGFTDDEIREAVREGIRNPDSPYPKEMEPYTMGELSDAELELIIDYLRSLE